jgi:hypothetical protein
MLKRNCVALVAVLLLSSAAMAQTAAQLASQSEAQARITVLPFQQLATEISHDRAVAEQDDCLNLMSIVVTYDPAPPGAQFVVWWYTMSNALEYYNLGVAYHDAGEMDAGLCEQQWFIGNQEWQAGNFALAAAHYEQCITEGDEALANLSSARLQGYHPAEAAWRWVADYIWEWMSY